MCGISYDEAARLRPGLKEQVEDARGPLVELHILDEVAESGDSEDEAEEGAESDVAKVSSRQRQAALIARRIREMVGAETSKSEFEVFDKSLQKFTKTGGS